MPDPRLSKLAKVLVQYSLNLQPGEQFVLRTSPLAEELNLEVYKEAILWINQINIGQITE